MPQSEMITLAHLEGKKINNNNNEKRKNRAAGQIICQATGKRPGAPNGQSQRTLAEPSDDRMIEMADKKQKRKTSAEQKKAYTVSTPDATVVATVENHLKYVSIHHK